MTEIIDTVQLQEVGDALIELFEVTLPSGTVVHLLNGMDGETDNIYFSDKTGTVLNEYVSFPLQIEGIEIKSSGVQNRPVLSVANIPSMTRGYGNTSSGSSDETTLLDILANEGFTTNEDLLNTRVVYRQTLFKYTQKAGDTPEIPTEFPSATYIIDRVSTETNIFVQFELASPVDLEGLTLPNRVVIGKYCPWRYQGVALSGEGGCIWPLDSNGLFFDSNDDVISRANASGIAQWQNNITYNSGITVKTTTNNHTQLWQSLRFVPLNKNPEQNPVYWKRRDTCGKLINSCKIRFQGNNINSTLDTSVSLPFGGFPGSRSFK